MSRLDPLKPSFTSGPTSRLVCGRCHGANPAHARFCLACGAPLTRPCAACAGELPADARFCLHCGEPVTADARERFDTPAAYTPRHLARKILAARDVLEGERKHVTILFADMKGSTELVAERDPEEARKLLDPVLERMMEAVHRYEGTVNQVMGDGIMALFGAPITHEDHAVRACYAALRMQESVTRYARSLRDRQGVSIAIRVGMNSGEVVVREVGSDLRTDYSAVGRITHLAARLEQLAQPGTILVSAATVRLAAGWIEVSATPPMTVKGLAEPVEAFELRDVTPVRSRLDVSARRGLTPFVNRGPELEQLDHAAKRVAAGDGQLVAVLGDAGVGKSRLLREFVRGPSLVGWRVLEAGALPHTRTASFLPVRALLEDYFGTGGDDPRVTADKVRAAQRADDPRTLAPLLALLGAPVDEAGWTDLDSDHRRRRMLGALVHVFRRAAEREPMCLLIEDLHWIDAESQTILDALVEALASARLLLLTTYRPEYTHAWAGRRGYTQIWLDPLAADAAGALVESLVGGTASESLGRLVLERTAGNPFFIEETLRHVEETGALANDRAARSVLEIPDTVRAVLAARIDRLPAPDKAVMQAAAVIGIDVPRSLLAPLVDMSADELDSSLARLQRREFLHATHLFPELRLAFRHALTQEVAFASLLADQRRALDMGIVETLEQGGAGGGTQPVERLAHHAFRAELWDKAVMYARLAGRAAVARSANRSGVTYFEQALAALDRLPESRERTEQAIDLILELRYALSPLAELRQIRERLTQAERLARSIDDPRRLGLTHAFLTNVFTLRGDFVSALEHGEEALRIVEQVRDTPLAALTSAFLGLAFWGRGDFGRALDVAGRNVELLAGDLAFERFGMSHLPSVYSRTVMAWSLAELGDFDAAATISVEAMRIAESSEHPHSMAFAAMGRGFVHLRRAEYREAADTLERARAIAVASDLPTVLLELTMPLASAYARGGHPEQAIEVLEAGIEQAVALRHRLGHWLRTGGLAEAYVCAGRLEEARPLAELYVEFTRLVQARGSEAWALLLLGEIAAAQGTAEHEIARSSVTAALARGEELRMRPLVTRCRALLDTLTEPSPPDPR